MVEDSEGGVMDMEGCVSRGDASVPARRDVPMNGAR